MGKASRAMILNKVASEVLILVPAYNESKTIGSLVENIFSKGYDVLVVDDGSKDGTGKLAELTGANVVVHEVNRGYDMALKSGVEFAKKKNYKFLVTFDADGQHDVEDLMGFINCLEEGCDVVVGVRPQFQRFGESLFAMLSILFWGIKDPLCGFKGYKVEALNKAPYFDSYGSIGTEFTIRAARSGFAIQNLEINLHLRNGSPKFGSGIRPNLKIVRALILGIIYAKSIPKYK